ncbi:MAG: GTPase [Candidatus Promineifilaceae bacterium]|nr:GTPase [Candidatus Promineifilaceae bacterium]
MTEIEKLLQEFPPESRQLVRRLWEALPEGQRQELALLLPVLPHEPRRMRRLFELSHEQLQMAFGDKHAVAIVGPANVGKSTLYNQLISTGEEAAEVSPVPGTTRENQVANAGPFSVVDTPGADAVGPVGARERKLALEAAAEADFLVIMFDAVQGIKQTELDLFRDLQALYRPYVVVLNKMDLVGREKEAVMAKAAANLGIAPEEMIPISAQEGEGLEQLVLAIVKAEPGLIAALGRGLPTYRWHLAWRVISGASSTAGLIALTPLPFLDFIPLVATQVSMILGIARIYNYTITPARAREILSTFGLGFLGRTLFYELTKLGGPPTWLIAAAVAAGTTVALGYGAILWFDRGERLTRETASEITRLVTDSLLDSLQSLGSRERPSRQSLKERLREALEQIPVGSDSDTLFGSSPSSPAGAEASGDDPGAVSEEAPSGASEEVVQKASKEM